MMMVMMMMMMADNDDRACLYHPHNGREDRETGCQSYSNTRMMAEKHESKKHGEGWLRLARLSQLLATAVSASTAAGETTPEPSSITPSSLAS